MKEILVAIGMSVLGAINPQAADIQSAQQQDESTTLLIAEMSELDEKLWYARQASNEKNFEEAIKLFEELEQLDSDRYYWAAISGQTNIYRRQYNIDAAKAVADRAAEKYPEAVGLMHIWKGDMQMQIKDHQKALQEYQLAEENYGQTIVNDMVIGEVALKQAARAAIQAREPAKAAQFARKIAEQYPQTGNPEAALARALIYETMAQGDLEIQTLENVLYNKICDIENPCFISGKRLKNKNTVNKDLFQQLNNFAGLYFELDEQDKNVLEIIKQAQQPEKNNSLLKQLLPEAQAQTVSFSTCSVALETAYDGFSDPIEDITRGDLFMTYPAAASTVTNIYHPGVDLNNDYDHVSGDSYDCSNPNDHFITTAAGCVQDTSTTDWGSLTITHNYLPYNATFASDYITSQYGHADEIYVSVGDAVAAGEEVGSIGGVGGYACHLHFEMREPDHPDPYNAGYWSSYTLNSQDNVGLWYQDPESFIDSHPAFDWAMWVDESSSMWAYSGSWTYTDTKGNGNDYGENDLYYTSTTSSSTADATATLDFTAINTGEHNLWIHVPWSEQTKSTSTPVSLYSLVTGSVLISTTLDFYGDETPGVGTCDEDIDGDGVYEFDPSKRCDEWISIGSVDLIEDERYALRISNNTGSGDDIIIIDDILITYGEGIAAMLGMASYGDSDGSVTVDTCAVSSSGDWTITSNCSIDSAETAPANVRVEDGITLTIGGSGSLDMDLSSYHIIIGDGSRLIIESGGKID